MFLPEEGPVSADQFARAVFLADNIDPDTVSGRQREHLNAIRKVFVEHMGAEVVDARELEWSDLE
jgi:hypothetical protein